MKRKLLIGAMLMAVLVIAVGMNMPTSAAVGDHSYQIRVVSGGIPLQDAYVRLSGVGIEMTDNLGIATFDMTTATGRGKGKQGLWRGPRYAAIKGKTSGEVIDEFDLFRVVISSHDIGEDTGSGSSFTMGTEVYLKLDAVYDISIR